MLYLDSSALVKLVVAEPETPALRDYLRNQHGEHWVTSMLARVEVPRAVVVHGTDAVDLARELLDDVDQVPLSPDLLDEAAGLAPGVLRSLDAIHVATAARLATELVAVVAYDQRLLQALDAVGLPGASPA